MAKTRTPSVSTAIAAITIGTTLCLLLAGFGGPGIAQASEQTLEASSILQTQTTSTAALDKAKSLFGITDDEHVLEAKNVSALTQKLNEAKAKATAEKPYIVHVPSGTFKLTTRVSIPINVILVSESDVQFIWNGAGAINDHMINVAGSIYGGTFSGGSKPDSSKVSSVIRFNYAEGTGTFTGKNGIVQKATVMNGNKNGICVREPQCEGAQIISCVVKNNYWNGITIEKDASCKLIKDVKSANNGHGAEGSGINISHANVTKIVKCKLLSNKDKGISTNSDPISGYKQAGCAIGTVSDCTIQKNAVNGIYLKPKCSIKNFTGNTVSENGDGLVCAGTTAAGTTGSSAVKNVNNNTFSANKRGQVVAQDQGAVVYLGSNNKIINGQGSGILASKSNNKKATKGGIVNITGDNNVINGNKLAGFSVQNGGQLNITGKSTQIKSNTTQGIYCNAGKVTISGTGTQILSNGKMGIAGYAKSTITISGAKTALKSNKSTGIYVIGSSTLTVSGKSCVIQGCTDMGIMAKSSTVSITGASASIASNKSAGIGIYDSAKLTMSGKSSKIQKNGTFGIYAKNKATATVSNTAFSGNSKGNSYATDGAKVTIK